MLLEITIATIKTNTNLKRVKKINRKYKKNEKKEKISSQEKGKKYRNKLPLPSSQDKKM